MALVFISHSSKDNEKIKYIYDELKKNSFDTTNFFLDFDKIKKILFSNN